MVKQASADANVEKARLRDDLKRASEWCPREDSNLHGL